MIYLDNAATTYPKPVSVLHSAEKALYDYGANPGRSGHRLSLETSRQVFYAREKCAEFLAVKPKTRFSRSTVPTPLILPSRAFAMRKDIAM